MSTSLAPRAGGAAGIARDRPATQLRLGVQATVDAMYLNTMWVVACLPLLTAPAATTALFVALDAWRTTGERPSFRAFVSTTRARFVPSTLIGLMGVAALSSGTAYLDLATSIAGWERWMMLGVLIILGEAASLCVIFVFTPLAKLTQPSPLRVVAESARMAALRPLNALAATGVVGVCVLVTSVMPLAVVLVGATAGVAVERLGSRALIADQNHKPR